MYQYNSGMPSWKDAVQHIGNLLGLGKIENSDFLKIPQYYYNSHGKQAYNTLMREIFKDGINLPVSNIHRKILKFVNCNNKLNTFNQAA